MAVSNDTGWIVLTTGNKSEMATGYSTLYGDSAGGFAVIKDVPKTLVYELCRYRNGRDRAGPGPIPEAVLEKAPSAELRADQRDDQSLPPYEVLDPVLAAYVEQDRTPPEMIADGLRPGGRRPGGAPGRRGGVQAPPDAARGAHHDEGLRQGPAHAHHQPLPVAAPHRRGAGVADPAEEGAPARGPLGLTAAAALLGAYCFVERRLFELTGAWSRRGRPAPRSPSTSTR